MGLTFQEAANTGRPFWRSYWSPGSRYLWVDGGLTFRSAAGRDESVFLAKADLAAADWVAEPVQTTITSKQFWDTWKEVSSVWYSTSICVEELAKRLGLDGPDV